MARLLSLISRTVLRGMGLMSSTTNKNKVALLSLEKYDSVCEELLGIYVDKSTIQALCDLNLLTSFVRDGDRLILIDDLTQLVAMLSHMSEPQNVHCLNWNIFWKKPLFIKLSQSTRIELVSTEKLEPVFYSAAHNLCCKFAR